MYTSRKLISIMLQNMPISSKQRAKNFIELAQMAFANKDKSDYRCQKYYNFFPYFLISVNERILGNFTRYLVSENSNGLEKGFGPNYGDKWLGNYLASLQEAYDPVSLAGRACEETKTGALEDLAKQVGLGKDELENFLVKLADFVGTVFGEEDNKIHFMLNEVVENYPDYKEKFNKLSDTKQSTKLTDCRPEYSYSSSLRSWSNSVEPPSTGTSGGLFVV